MKCARGENFFCAIRIDWDFAKHIVSMSGKNKHKIDDLKLMLHKLFTISFFRIVPHLHTHKTGSSSFFDGGDSERIDQNGQIHHENLLTGKYMLRNSFGTHYIANI